MPAPLDAVALRSRSTAWRRRRKTATAVAIPTNHLPSSQRTAALSIPVVVGYRGADDLHRTIDDTDLELVQLEINEHGTAVRGVCDWRRSTSTEGPVRSLAGCLQINRVLGVFAHVPQVPENRGKARQGRPAARPHLQNRRRTSRTPRHPRASAPSPRQELTPRHSGWGCRSQTAKPSGCSPSASAWGSADCQPTVAPCRQQHRRGGRGIPKSLFPHPRPFPKETELSRA